MANISIDDLAGAITDAVREYTEDVSAGIEREVDETAKEVLDEVRRNHPYKDRTGEYTKGFKITNRDQPGRARRVVWNKKHYRRVHLLEFGHAKRGGGRVPPPARPGRAYQRGARVSGGASCWRS